MSDEKVLDTLELSRLLLPWLPNHRLETVAEYCRVSPLPHHRAVVDAEATGLVFRELLSDILGLDLRTVRLINRILNGASDGLRLFFEKVGTFFEEYGGGKAGRRRQGPRNILGGQRKRSGDDEARKPHSMDIEAFFEPGGILSDVLPDYEPRIPQKEMARWVARVFDREAFLVAEAGTGGVRILFFFPAGCFGSMWLFCFLIFNGGGVSCFFSF